MWLARPRLNQVGHWQAGGLFNPLIVFRHGLSADGKYVSREGSTMNKCATTWPTCDGNPPYITSEPVLTSTIGKPAQYKAIRVTYLNESTIILSQWSPIRIQRRESITPFFVFFHYFFLPLGAFFRETRKRYWRQWTFCSHVWTFHYVCQFKQCLLHPLFCWNPDCTQIWPCFLDILLQKLWVDFVY